MKKLLLTFGMALLLFSCSSNSPEGVAKGFAESLAHGNIEKAKEYATDGTGKLLDMISGLGDGVLPKDPDFKFEKIKDSVSGDKAWITFKNQEGNEETLNLTKKDGKWLVDMQPKK